MRHEPTLLFQVDDAVRDALRRDREGAAQLKGLGLLCVFGGHADAGYLSKQVRDAILDHLDHRLLLEFDADQLIDYRARRPRISYDGSVYRDFRGPRLRIHLVNDLLGNSFLLLSGPEPDFKWERFVESVQFIAEQLDITAAAFVDSMPLPVPHTRRLGVTTHGTFSEVLDGLSTWSPQVNLQAGVGHLLEMRLGEGGLPTAGFSLHIPHYLQDTAYPQGAVVALEYAGAALRLMLPTEELRERGREVDRELDRQTESSEDIRTMVRGLEQNYDDHPVEADRSLLMTPDQRIPSGDELGSAVEAYLASRPRHVSEARDADGTSPAHPANGRGESPDTRS